MPDTPSPSLCQDCGTLGMMTRATHGLVQTKRGWYLSLPVRTGARWCKAHGVAEAKRRNTVAAVPGGRADA